jgi:3-hydroxybutyryl-CoA dehydratase
MKDSYKIEEILPGMSASLSHLVTDEDVRGFAEVSGDRNPVHLDEEYAKQSRFGRRIAHGLFLSLIHI